MDGYTKIYGTNKSRSNNISDLQSLPQHHKTNENLSPNNTVFHDVIYLESISKSQQSKNQEPHDENENEKENQDAIANEENMKGNSNNNNIPSAVKLSRACSVSSAASANRFRLERQGNKNTTTSFESVKRAFSMRRSSSVSEKYCRIHDQGFTISSPILDDVAEAHEDSREKKKKKNGRGRILKACKRLFGI
ncbi:hypothetical protein R3W88_003279 [Solanum pinnatisectum]|uniref:Uncharacterized protein n=1 Tax=Solanum pinnatisectum TaxID=50273 RepID=A0AAV9MNJ1_9SOLN|nr:hypothetical protein R3W88_003279 [Solanum pinnatisectum]